MQNAPTRRDQFASRNGHVPRLTALLRCRGGHLGRPVSEHHGGAHLVAVLPARARATRVSHVALLLQLLGRYRGRVRSGDRLARWRRNGRTLRCWQRLGAALDAERRASAAAHQQRGRGARRGKAAAASNGEP